MAAHAIVKAVNKKMIAVNYADIESKYVGETSKNLTALFSFAKNNDPFHLEITLDMGFGVTDELKETVTIRRGELYALFESKVKED